jgi:hypothetical protein
LYQNGLKSHKIARFFTVFDAIMQSEIVISECAGAAERGDGGEGSADLPPSQ